MGARISYCWDCDEFETNAVLPASDMTGCYFSYLGHQDYCEEGYSVKTTQYNWKTSKSFVTFVMETLSQIYHDMNVEFEGRRNTFQVQN